MAGRQGVPFQQPGAPGELNFSYISKEIDIYLMIIISLRAVWETKGNQNPKEKFTTSNSFPVNLVRTSKSEGREKHSATTALLKLTNYFSQGLDK